mmetsp:Transcript_44452/g.117533  ORF Transcript_44452/g.117533 Transcript_44452/m.117533 type:complete len:392 (-) Transcript_44452:926-2101(-)
MPLAWRHFAPRVHLNRYSNFPELEKFLPKRPHELQALHKLAVFPDVQCRSIRRVGVTPDADNQAILWSAATAPWRNHHFRSETDPLVHHKHASNFISFINKKSYRSIPHKKILSSVAAKSVLQILHMGLHSLIYLGIPYQLIHDKLVANGTAKSFVSAVCLRHHHTESFGASQNQAIIVVQDRSSIHHDLRPVDANLTVHAQCDMNCPFAVVLKHADLLLYAQSSQSDVSILSFPHQNLNTLREIIYKSSRQRWVVGDVRQVRHCWIRWWVQIQCPHGRSARFAPCCRTFFNRSPIHLQTADQFLPFVYFCLDGLQLFLKRVIQTDAQFLDLLAQRSNDLISRVRRLDRRNNNPADLAREAQSGQRSGALSFRRMHCGQQYGARCSSQSFG